MQKFWGPGKHEKAVKHALPPFDDCFGIGSELSALFLSILEK